MSVNVKSKNQKVVEITSKKEDDLSPSVIRMIRERIGYGKKEMANFLGAGYSTYRSWEDENSLTHKNMSGAARTLLKICAVDPYLVKEALEKYEFQNIRDKEINKS